MSLPVLLAACGSHGGGASCGFAGVAGANLLLGAFGEPNQTLSAAPRRLPATLPVRLVAGALYTADVAPGDSAVTVTLRDPLPPGVIPGSGVLVQEPTGRTRGVVIYEAPPVAGAPHIGTFVSGAVSVPLVGIQVDLSRFEDREMPDLSRFGRAMTPPRIGITGVSRVVQGNERTGVNVAYVSSVLRAGGLPLVLSPLVPAELTGALAATLDGLLLTGGEDVAPALYGEAPHPALGDVDPRRDQLEAGLLHAARDLGVPVLGICRGIQLINAAMGGTLWQDLATQRADALAHNQQAGRTARTHAVTTMSGHPGGCRRPLPAPSRSTRSTTRPSSSSPRG